MRSVLGVHWKDWCWSWSYSTLATWWEELTHLKRPWCWERLRAGGEGEDRGWDGWMESLTQWTWVGLNSGSWWWTGRPGVLQFMGLQRVGHDWVTELKRLGNRNSTEYNTKLASDQHPDWNSPGKPQDTAHLESQLGKGRRQCVHSMGEALTLQFKVPPYHPRMQTDVINLRANSSSGFILMLFVLSYETWMFLNLGLGWSEPLWTTSGVNNLKICVLFDLWCCKPCTHSRQSGYSQSGCVQAGWMHRGMHYFVLKPKQDYLFNFSNTLVAAW